MRKLLLLVGALVLVDSMFFAGLTPPLPHLATTFHLSKTGAGILTGVYATGAIFGALPGGIVAARAGVKPTVLAGLAGAAWTSPAPVAEARQPLRMLARALRSRQVATGLWFSVLPGFLFGILTVLAPLRLHELGFGALGIGAIFLISGLIEGSLS